jgi:hypothetical protein
VVESALRSRRLTSKELGHVIMCAYGAPRAGIVNGRGVTGNTLTRTVSDLLRSRRPLRSRDDGDYRTCLTARCASATNPVAPGTASVIPPTKTQAAVPDETLAHA